MACFLLVKDDAHEPRLGAGKMDKIQPEATTPAADRGALPLREVTFHAQDQDPSFSRHAPSGPVDQDATPEIKTTALAQVARIRNPAALQFALTQAWALCDARQIPRPQLSDDVGAFVPCRLLVTTHRNLATDECIGRLRLIADDGRCYQKEWQISAPKGPVR